ncbi:MAG: insulinase family protein [Bacteroidota bacterium]|nr:MAG: insulinase family protein [Bacteroidota bacterium]
MLKKITAFATAFIVAGTAMAQKNLPSNFHMKKLGNGLEVLVIEDNSVPLVTIEICVKNGSFTEDSAFNGLSHLYEHMFFKANKAIPSQEKFLERVNELGISFNGTTSEERVNYFFTLSNKLINEGLEFMNNAIRYPLFLEQEMKNENPVVDGEFQRAESNPAFFLFQDFNKQMWGSNYVRKNAIGIHDVILSATPAKMNVIKDKYYYPNNSILVVAGDVEHNAVFEKAEKMFGDWKPCDFDPFQKWPIPEFAPLVGQSKFLTVDKNAKMPIMMMGFHGPDTRNDVKSTYAADVFSTILGLTSSEFQKTLVDGGYALQTGLGYQTCRYTGPIQLFMVPNPMKMKSFYGKLMEQVNRFDAPDYFTDEHLETAKNKLIMGYIYNKEKTSAYVHTVTFWWASASIDYYTTYNDMIKKVTRKDIADYVDKYIKGKPSVTGLLLNPKMKESLGINSADEILK